MGGMRRPRARLGRRRDATGLSVAAKYRAAVLADSPLHLWDLQDASAPTATDRGSTPHDGTYTQGGGATYTLGQPGPLAGSYGVKFATGGVAAAYVDVADAADLDIIADLTLECWWKCADTTGTSDLFTKGTFVSFNVPYLFTLSAGTLTHGWGNAAEQTTRTIVSGPALVNDTFYHLALTRNGATIKFYVNGVEYAASSTFTTATANALSTRLGNRNSAVATLKDTTLAYAAIWGSALSAAQIAAHYAARLG